MLPPADVQAATALAEARHVAPHDRRVAIARVAARWPRYIDAWVGLAECARDDIERYAYYRVAYHRGLDLLRANGWRGTGYVRWRHESNRGFLRAVRGLGSSARTIGEHDEADRCAQFLVQLDPSGVPAQG
jgi:hypothetical protein